MRDAARVLAILEHIAAIGPAMARSKFIRPDGIKTDIGASHPQRHKDAWRAHQEPHGLSPWT
jgi:hypothetical protein